ncbi:MAG: hypothetical protein A2Z32_05960 [Chloroflexi bacterium RBG_16_69_14]|nr:MAG: hypothetical protein A2Z32_05960 [Chloroflexi bacterium RBG_16_69_14]
MHQPFDASVAGRTARTALARGRTGERDWALEAVRPDDEASRTKEVPVMAYEISRREVPDQPIVSIRERMAAADLPAFCGRSFGELYGHLQLLGVPPTGEPFVLYHAFGPDDIDAEACVPFTGDITASGRITARVLPAATVVETLHIGPYDELPNAYAALSGWIAQNGLEPVWPVRERYLNEPGPDVPPTAYRTVIAMPIAEVAVPAR